MDTPESKLSYDHNSRNMGALKTLNDITSIFSISCSLGSRRGFLPTANTIFVIVSLANPFDLGHFGFGKRCTYVLCLLPGCWLFNQHLMSQNLEIIIVRYRSFLKKKEEVFIFFSPYQVHYLHVEHLD